MKDRKYLDVTLPRIMAIYANAIFAMLWAGFFLALAINREWLDLVWNWSQALPLAERIVVWLLFLPILVGLWIWESSWTSFARLVGLIGIIAWTLVAVASIFRNFRQNHPSSEIQKS